MKNLYLHDKFEDKILILKNENCDIAIAMSSSCADPVLGLNNPTINWDAKEIPERKKI